MAYEPSVSVKTQKNTNKPFTRLPQNIIDNELFVLQKQIKAFYDSITYGDDINMSLWNGIISNIDKIKSSMKTFNNINEVPNNYK